jgi:hypothetical protein
VQQQNCSLRNGTGLGRCPVGPLRDNMLHDASKLRTQQRPCPHCYQLRLIKCETTLPTELLSSSEDRLTDLVTRPIDVALLCPALCRAYKKSQLRTCSSARSADCSSVRMDCRIGLCSRHTAAASRVSPQIKIA